MNTNIKTTNISLSPAISDYVSKRMESVTRLMDGDPTVVCDIEVGRTTSHHKQGDIFRAEIHIVAQGKNFYASSEKSDLYAAIDDVRDEIVRSITSQKEKRLSLVRKGGAMVKNMLRGMWPGKGKGKGNEGNV